MKNISGHPGTGARLVDGLCETQFHLRLSLKTHFHRINIIMRIKHPSI